jgi:hypothetical protein
MLSLTDRIDRMLLSEAKRPTHIVVDLSDLAAVKRAIDSTRGPCTGWDDYLAGKDYQPPYVWNTAETAGVRTNKVGERVQITAPPIPIGPVDNRGNQHSNKYHGIRPWDPDELLRAVSRRTGDPDTEGKLWQIAHKLSVQNAHAVTGRSFDAEDSVQLGLHAVNRALARDDGMPGVRFTSYAGHDIETGMVSGVPAGYGDEYRKARGLILRLDKEGKRALRNLREGNPANSERDRAPDARGRDRDPDPPPADAIQAMLDEIDPVPGKRNPYGMLVPKLLEAGGAIIAAIFRDNEQDIRRSLEFLGETREQIEEEESTYRVRGTSTDTLVTKSKENPAIRTKPMTVPGIKTGKEMERTKDILKPGLAPTKRDDPAGSEYDPSHPSIRDRPETVEAIAMLVRILRSGSGQGPGWEATLAYNALEQLQHAVTNAGQERSERQYEIRKVHQGFEVVDSKHEAEDQIGGLQGDPLAKSVDSVLDSINSEYGGYRDEVLQVARAARGMFRSHDYDQREEILEEIDSLMTVAEQDKKSGDIDIMVEPLTQQQYRVMLRLYGIKEYPERGTKDDPEMDPSTGQLSQWAKMGYPPIPDDNRFIARDIGVSDARVSQIRRKIEIAVPHATEIIQREMLESGQIDIIDYNILTDVRIALGGALLERLHPSSRRLVC